MHLILYPLSADAEKFDATAVTPRTEARRLYPIVTLMADQLFLRSVICKGNIASLAARDIAAVAALDEGGTAAPIEEEYYLLPSRQRLFDSPA